MALFASRATAGATWGRRLASQGPGRPAPPCGGHAPCGPTAAPSCRASAKPPASARIRVCCPPAIGNRPPCPTKNLEKTWTCENPLRRKKTKPCVEVPPMKDCECDEFYVMRRIAAAKALHRALYKEEVCAGEPPAQPCTEQYCLPSPRDTLHGEDGRRHELLEPVPPPRCPAPGCPPPSRRVLVASDTCPQAAASPCDHVPRDVVQIDRCTRRPPARCAGSSLPCSPPKGDNPCGLTTKQEPNSKHQCGTTSSKKNDEGLASRLVKSCLNMNKNSDDSKNTSSLSNQPQKRNLPTARD